eukprot:1765783-Pleurochrysis_carterae.AAC.1
MSGCAPRTWHECTQVAVWIREREGRGCVRERERGGGGPWGKRSWSKQCREKRRKRERGRVETRGADETEGSAGQARRSKAGSFADIQRGAGEREARHARPVAQALSRSRSCFLASGRRTRSSKTRRACRERVKMQKHVELGERARRR